MKETLVAEAGGKCWICGYDRCIDAFEFHHLERSEKDIKMSMAGGHALATYRDEAAKCLLLCGNCHALVEEDCAGPRSRWQVARAVRRRAVLEASGGACAVTTCRFDACDRALVFHHLDPATKRSTLGSDAMTSMEAALAESEKCVLLCRNCHAEVEAGVVAAPGTSHPRPRVVRGRPRKLSAD